MLKKSILVVALCAIVAVGTVGYMALKPTAEASQPITAVPIEVASATAAPVLESSAQVQTETENAVAAQSADNAAPETEVSAPLVFEIIPEESQVRFIIDEVLNGSPKTVVGATNQVAGQIAVNPDAVHQTQVGVIRINARTLTTDDAMRNRTIGNRILFTGDYEYITFTPTSVTNLPSTITVGEAITFQIEGELTVRDVTQPVTFEARVTPVSETRLEGSAGTTIRYDDFGISIPRVPSVADVDEEVVLEIDFAAEAV